MVGAAVGYHSRAFVTFGEPIPVADWDPHARRDILRLAKDTLEIIGRLYKVLPTAIVAAATRPSIPQTALLDAVSRHVDTLLGAPANMDATDPRDVVEQGLELLAERGVVALERGVVRVRDRHTLRYYARTIDHLLAPARRTGRTH
jgi:hypothetical protein